MYRDDIEINDKQYWDLRFETDWDESQGRQQSRYFARVALDNLPSWLVQLARAQRMTICDWGCAEGDGTDVLAGYFGAGSVTGVDFSDAAIRKAASFYPQLKFLVEDWVTAAAPSQQYDVVFSSNTLEHFHDPHSTLQRLMSAASKCVVLLLPYREFERHPEHHHTFEASNLAVAPSREYALVHSIVIDASRHQPCYWPGLQILLVYARTSFLADSGVVLKDLSITDEHATALCDRLLDTEQELARRDASIAQLNDAVGERERRILGLVGDLEAEKKRSSRLYAQVAEGRTELQRIRDVLATRDQELQGVARELATIKATRGWKYLTALHLVRKRVLPEGSLRYRGVRTVYRSGRFLARCARNANRRNIGLFLNYMRLYGPRVALDRTRTYLSRAQSFAPTEQAVARVDVRANGRADELLAYLRDRQYAGVFVMGSCCMGWHEVFKQRPHHIADYLMSAGYLVLCAMNPVYQDDFTDCIKRDGEHLFLVNFDDRAIWREFIELLAVESRAPLFYHLVGTEPGTSLQDIERLKRLGYTFMYDFIDEISKDINPGISDFCLLRHEYLLRDEDVLVVASADNLYRQCARYRKRNLICAPNGVRLEDWTLEDNPPVPEEIQAIVDEGKPIVGYYGSFAAWMNYELIKALSRARPDVNIVMIGYDYEWGKGAFAQSRISELPNVHILPAQKYHRLKYFSRFFDAGIVPFREYELTKSVSPLKMFEYMAQGIPVVTSGMDECRKYESCLVADDEQDFVAKVGHALTLKNDPEHRARLRRDAEANTWASRAKAIETSMLSMVQATDGTLLTVVVPTYNMEALLPRCMESMVAPSQFGRLEVIVVNDGSTDGSLELARKYERKYPGTVRVIDKENGGHGSCINAGIREATGKYFKVVDADDWLDPVDLTEHMHYLAKVDTDMVVTNYLRSFDGGRSELVSYAERLEEKVYELADFYRQVMVDNSSLSYAHMHAITYRTSLLQDNDIRITEKSFYVDQEYIAFPQKFIRKVSYENLALYRYYIGRPGQSVAPDVARKRAPDNHKILRNIISLYESLPESSERRPYLLNIAFHHAWFYLTYSDDDTAKRELMQWWQRTNWAISNELNRNFRIL